MLRMLRLFIGLAACSLCSRRELLLEILALRQQLNVFKAGHSRPRLTARDRVFWVVLRRFWPGWKRALLHVCQSFAKDQRVPSDGCGSPKCHPGGKSVVDGHA